jgi:hypothetical protein
MENLMSSRLFGEFLRSDEPGFKTRIEYLEWYEILRNNFDDFLKKPLEKWMLVPCDENGDVLEFPHREDYDMYDDTVFLLHIEKYQKAKERCYF